MPEVRVSVGVVTLDELVLGGLKVSAPALLYLLLCMCGPLVLSQFFLPPSFANTSADTVMLPWFLSLQEASVSSLGQSDMSEVFHKTLWCELCQGQQDAALGSRLNQLRSPKNFQCGAFFCSNGCLMVGRKLHKKMRVTSTPLPYKSRAFNVNKSIRLLA